MGVITKVLWSHDEDVPGEIVHTTVPDPDRYGLAITVITGEISTTPATAFYEGTLLVDKTTKATYCQIAGAWVGIGSGGGGTQGPPGPAGAPGPAGPAGAAGPGVAAGGTANQILAKIDSTNYNTHWIDNIGGDEVIIQPNQPGDPNTYELWVDTDASPVPPAVGTATLVGEMKMWPGATVPPLYLVCNGALISRTAYAGLFAALGTTWGAGDGTTTFALPDMRGRAPVGAGQGAGLSNRALGAAIGAETVALDATQIPAHTHPDSTSDFTGTDHTHAVNITSGAADRSLSHTHGLPANVVSNVAGGLIVQNSASGYNYNSTANPATGGGGVDHLHNVNGNTGGISANHQHTTHTPANTGGGGAHPNIQPSIVVNYIIYTGVP